ncbi:hypothetical protein Tco_0261864 [Tanacetum coccineum]
MEITVVTLVEEQMSPWKSNLPRLPIKSNISGGGVVDLNGDKDPTDEHEDIGMGDSTGVSASLGGEIFSRRKKCQESNIGDSDNTGDGGKIVGGAIGACGGIGCSIYLRKHAKRVNNKGLSEIKVVTKVCCARLDEQGVLKVSVRSVVLEVLEVQLARFSKKV